MYFESASYIFLAILAILFFISLYFSTRKCFSFKKAKMNGNTTLQDLQKEHLAWAQHNFPGRKSHHPLLGVTEECGELIDAMLNATAMLNVTSRIGALSHAHLKMAQGIRGTPEEHQAAKEDAVGDILIYLIDYCTLNKIDIGSTIEKTWAEVSKRDWVKFPRNGISE